MTQYEDLLQFAETPKQIEAIKALISEKSTRLAAKKLGVNNSSVDQIVRTLRKYAALRGYAPEADMTKLAPAPFMVKGTSTYYDESGKPRGQWVKTKVDDEVRFQMMCEIVRTISQELPKTKPVKPPVIHSDALCNVLTLTDCHIGMFAWENEGGDNWDIDIAERTLIGAFDLMIDRCVPAKTCIISQLGDFLHFDGLVPVTPTSKHILDASGRATQIIRTAIRVLRYVVSKALETHEKVILIAAEGNHDMGSSIWIRETFAAMYEKEPRLEVVQTELPYYAYKHGSVMLCWHHSHIKQMGDLPSVFAAMYPKMWGETTKRYAHTGDKHHTAEKEYAGMSVVQHPTLAAKDAWAARNGYNSHRRAIAITYHKQYGEYARFSVSPDMFQ